MSPSSGSSDWPPAPPDGYKYRDPPSSLPRYAHVLVALWAPCSVLAIISLVLVIEGFSETITLYFSSFPQTLPVSALYVGWVISLAILQLVIHELLHVLAAVVLGFNATIDHDVRTPVDWEVHVITFGAYQTRLQTTLITLAPLLLFTPVGIAILVIGGNGVTLIVTLLLLLNTSGAVFDVRTALLMLSLPSGDLVRFDSAGRYQCYTRERTN